MKINYKIYTLFIIILIKSCISSQDEDKPTFNSFLINQKEKLDILKKDFKVGDSLTESVVERLMNYYFKLFKILDKNSDGTVSLSELNEIADAFNWPKKEAKDGMSFSEFCKYMESLWETPNTGLADKENNKIEKAKGMLRKAFTFIDIGKNGFVNKDQLFKGLSTFLGTDVKESEVKNVFDYYNNSVITEDQFVLAILNGLLDNSLSRVIDLQQLTPKLIAIE